MNSIKNLALDQDKLNALKANEQALRQEIQRAEQAAREQEKREREALAQRQKAEEKRTSKPYQPTVQERQLINSTSGLGAAKKTIFLTSFWFNFAYFWFYPSRRSTLERYGNWCISRHAC